YARGLRDLRPRSAGQGPLLLRQLKPTRFAGGRTHGPPRPPAAPYDLGGNMLLDAPSVPRRRPRAGAAPVTVDVTALLASSFSSLLRNKLRTSLTILGVAIGIAAVICVVSIGKAGQARVE